MNKNEIQNKLKQMEQEMADLRKKLDEPELYRGWMPAKGEEYWVTGYTGRIYDFNNTPNKVTEIDKEESVFGIFPTEAEAKASYDRHMAGEECKKIISKWIAKLEPGWKPDWKQDSKKCFLYMHYNKNVAMNYEHGQHILQDEWYFPSKVANNDDFSTEIVPHFRKWLGVE